MKRNIAIVAGGDTSEIVVSLRSAQGIYSFIDKEKYNLYIVSNGTAVVQDSRIEKAKLATYFKKIFISEKLGVNKPDARFFELCFKEMPGIKKEETVIVGDSLTSDMLGGENAGIKNIWYNPKSQKNTLGVSIWREIHSLDEIDGIITE